MSGGGGGVPFLVKEGPLIIVKSTLHGPPQRSQTWLGLPFACVQNCWPWCQMLPLCISARETEGGLIGTGGKKRKKWVVLLSRALPIKLRRAIR